MRNAKLDKKPVIALITAAALLIAISANTAAATGDTDSARVTQSKHKQGDGRENAKVINETRDEYDAGTSTGRRSAKQTPGGVQKSRPVASVAANTEFWFYLADVELYADEDRDGFYSGIDLLFDVDTYYSAADIYAVVYLSYEGGPWEEYAVTEDFTIFGSSGTDDYVLVTDLVAGYPTGDYDLLIEIFDADFGDFLAYIGPEDTSELAFLPLEDIDRDIPTSTVTRVTVSSGSGGGSADLLTIMLLSVAAFALRRRLRFQPAGR